MLKQLVCRRFIKWCFGEKEAEEALNHDEVPTEAFSNAVGASEAGLTLQSYLSQAGENNWFGATSDITFRILILHGHLFYRCWLPDGFSVA